MNLDFSNSTQALKFIHDELFYVSGTKVLTTSTPYVYTATGKADNMEQLSQTVSSVLLATTVLVLNSSAQLAPNVSSDTIPSQLEISSSSKMSTDALPNINKTMGKISNSSVESNYSTQDKLQIPDAITRSPEITLATMSDVIKTTNAMTNGSLQLASSTMDRIQTTSHIITSDSTNNLSSPGDTGGKPCHLF